MSRWSLPEPGDIVWCHFPFLPQTEPGPKPRPALVVTVSTKEDGDTIGVAYGTSQRTNALRAGEFLISKVRHPIAYKQAGLALDTKFDLKQIVELPWSDRYFKVPATTKQGQHPRIGSLHASMMHALSAAYSTAQKHPQSK